MEQFPETPDIETSSDDYARRFAGPVGRWFLKLQEQATLEMMRPYPNASVLDAGGGHGQLTGPLLRAGHRVTVLGSSEACRSRIASYLEAGLADFQVGNLLQMPFPNRSFDLVVSYRLLPHVVRWQEFLREMTRVSKQAIILDYPEVRSVNYIAPYLFNVKKKMEANTREFACFRERDLVKALEEFGFKQTDRFPEFFLPMALHRRLGRARLSAGAEGFFRATGATRLFGSPVIMKAERV